MKKELTYLLGGAAIALVGKRALNPPITELEVTNFVSKWLRKVEFGGVNTNIVNEIYDIDPSAEVLNLYAKEATLVSTIGDVIYIGRDEIKGYFENFLKLEPSGVLKSLSIQLFGEIAVANGTYSFMMNSNGDVVDARFTYVLRKEGGVIKIATHHSSAQPEQQDEQDEGSIDGLLIGNSSPDDIFLDIDSMGTCLEVDPITGECL